VRPDAPEPGSHPAMQDRQSEIGKLETRFYEIHTLEE
jgi:hypothetical protein